LTQKKAADTEAFFALTLTLVYQPTRNSIASSLLCCSSRHFPQLPAIISYTDSSV
jgi:hypothetical protein